MLDFHPLANLFPLIEGRAFDDLVADIREHGLHEKIIILDGRILDGRNRYRAGIAAGLIDPDAPAHNGIAMQPWAAAYLEDVEGDPLAWVLGKNLHRRHLDESQRAIVASRIETLTHGGARVAQEARDVASTQPQPRQDANLQPAALRIDRKTAADMLNVSPRSVASAKKVIEQGAPELVAQVEQGRLAVSVAERLARMPKARQSEIIQATPVEKLKTVAKQEDRSSREAELATRQRALPTKLYGVILADPPWRFEPYSRETGLDRAADNHYPTQETSEIKMLPVGTLAAPDCVLYLWATAPMLLDALQAMRFWGFEYSSHVIWRKDRIGTGYLFRNQHELLLVGRRGHVPAPAPGTQWPSVVDAPVGKHSAKPDEFYELIESYFPNLPKIELNARRSRAGWDARGLEAPDEQPLLTAVDGVAATDGEVSAFAGATITLGPERPSTPSPVGQMTAVSNPPLANPSEAPALSPSDPQWSDAATREGAGAGASDPDTIIRAGYAAGGPKLIERLCAETGLSANQVKGRARRLGLSGRERQREAVAEANRRRGGGSEC